MFLNKPLQQAGVALDAIELTLQIGAPFDPNALTPKMPKPVASAEGDKSN